MSALSLREMKLRALEALRFDSAPTTARTDRSTSSSSVSLLRRALIALRIRSAEDDFIDVEVSSASSSTTSSATTTAFALSTRKIIPLNAMLTPDTMRIFLREGLRDEHKFDLGGLHPVATTPLTSCNCHHSPLHLRDRLTRDISSDVSRAFPPSEHLSVLFFGSGHLGNETIISCELLRKQHIGYTFHLVDPIYDRPRVVIPKEDCGKEGVVNDHVEKAMLAYDSRLAHEQTEIGKSAGKTAPVKSSFHTNNASFIASKEPAPQVFIMIDPGDAFRFLSRMATNFYQCIKEKRAAGAPCLIYILARGEIYTKSLSPTETADTDYLF